MFVILFVLLLDSVYGPFKYKPEAQKQGNGNCQKQRG
jgi:hypothetical protein